jgi:flagellar biosynthesis/type III secretory pathway chaperone
MSHALEQLMCVLRDELAECGELLALLQEQQSHIIARSAERLLQNAGKIRVQFEKLSAVCQLRDECQRQYAVDLGFPASSSFGDLSARVEISQRQRLALLVSEIQGLFARLHQWLWQNHNLLSRSLVLQQQLIKEIFPGTRSAGDSRHG